MKNILVIVGSLLSFVSLSQNLSKERVILSSGTLAISNVDSVYIQQNPIASSQTIEQLYTSSQAHRSHLVPLSGESEQKNKSESLNAIPASTTPQQLYLEPQSSKLHLVPLEEKPKDPK